MDIASSLSAVRYNLVAGNRAGVLVLSVLVGCMGSLILAAAATALSPVMAVVAIVGMVVTAAMMVSPTASIVVLCFSLPFERIGRFTNDSDAVTISAARILGLIALASLLLHTALKKQKLHFGIAFFLYAGYTAMALLSYTWAFAPEETWKDSLRVVGNLLFFFVIFNLVRDYAMAKRVLMAWLLATFLAGSYSLADYYYSGGINPIAESQMGLTSTRSATVVADLAELRSLGVSVRRLFGTTAHPTLFGLNNTLAIPFLFWAIRTSRHAVLKLFWSAALLVCVYCILLSNTRAVFLIAVFTILFCLWIGLLKPGIQSAICLVLIGISVLPFIPEDVYRRTLDIGLYTTEKGDAIRVRFKFWAKSWELIQSTWMHGIGVGNQTTIQKMVTDEQTGYLSTSGLRASAHNEFIWVMVEVGIIGYLLHWGFVGRTIWSGFASARIFRRDGNHEQYLFALACQALLVAVPFFALQSEAFHYPLKAWWLAAGVSCSMLTIARSKHEETA